MFIAFWSSPGATMPPSGATRCPSPRAQKRRRRSPALWKQADIGGGRLRAATTVCGAANTRFVARPRRPRDDVRSSLFRRCRDGGATTGRVRTCFPEGGAAAAAAAGAGGGTHPGDATWRSCVSTPMRPRPMESKRRCGLNIASRQCRSLVAAPGDNLQATGTTVKVDAMQ